MSSGTRRRERAVAPPKKNKIKKMNFFGQTFDAIWAKINHTNLIYA